MSQEDTIELLEELLTSVKQRGYKKTIGLLKTNIGIESLVLDEHQRNVITIVAEEFGITLEDIVSSRYMRGENKYAVGFCVLYLYSRYTLGEIQKNIFKNKTKTLLSKYRNMILELNKNEKVSEIKRIIDIKEKLDKRIENV
jgi:hypothetical protein